MTPQMEQQRATLSASATRAAERPDLDQHDLAVADLPRAPRQRRRITSAKRAEIAEFYRIVLACHLVSETGGVSHGSEGRR